MSTHRPPAFLLSGSLGLDFLNTLATPVDTQVDWIDDGDGLLAWLDQAKLVPAKDLKALKVLAIPGEFDAVAAQARSLREWFGDLSGAERQETRAPTTCPSSSRSIASSAATSISLR